MKKKLSEMTPEELWELFPIFLVPHDERWEDNYREAENSLKTALAEFRIRRLSHIGSTAIEGIWAKNIVDILLEIEADEDMEAVASVLCRGDWISMSREPERVSLKKGYTEDGFAEKVYHLHLRFAGDNDELYFRDYMNACPAAAKEYEALKLRLWREYEHNRDGYTSAKGELIGRYTKEARALYPRRYDE